MSDKSINWLNVNPIDSEHHATQTISRSFDQLSPQNSMFLKASFVTIALGQMLRKFGPAVFKRTTIDGMNSFQQVLIMYTAQWHEQITLTLNIDKPKKVGQIECEIMYTGNGNLNTDRIKPIRDFIGTILDNFGYTLTGDLAYIGPEENAVYEESTDDHKTSI